MTILITGATGLIGQELVSLCHEQGIVVHYLTTSQRKIEDKENYKGFYWSPKDGEIDITCFESVDVIINLVGASVSKRWTAAYKKEIIESRTQSARLIFQTLSVHKHQVKQIVSASAIGIYKDSLTNYYEENSEDISDAYLGKVVEAWEESVDQFKTLNISVSKIRIGLVLSNKGGALPEIAKPIKFGVGAAFGSGEQWQSWIHIADLTKIFMYVVQYKIEGVINGVAPNPVTNIEFTKTAGRVLKRPIILPNIPKFVIKLILGEMHVILFSSQRVSSKRIEDLGYDFEHHHLEPALENLLK